MNMYLYKKFKRNQEENIIKRDFERSSIKTKKKSGKSRKNRWEKKKKERREFLKQN